MAPSDPDTPLKDEPVSTPDDSDELSLPEGSAEPQADAPDDLAEGEEEEAKQKLVLEVDVQTRSACERHIVTRISREDVDRFLDKEYSELVTSAQVPGFRPGHAPRKLVEKRFHKDVAERVKGSLLADAISQLTDEQKLTPISEPSLDIDAVEVPAEGPMTFEFDIEVRPDFDLPQWKGMTIERPVREFTDEDVDRALKNLLGAAAPWSPTTDRRSRATTSAPISASTSRASRSPARPRS